MFCAFLGPIKPAHPSELFGRVRVCLWGGDGGREMKGGRPSDFLVR